MSWLGSVFLVLAVPAFCFVAINPRLAIRVFRRDKYMDAEYLNQPHLPTTMRAVGILALLVLTLTLLSNFLKH